MIARIWHGRVPASKSDAYYAYLLQTGLQEYAATPGNKGVQVLRMTEDAVTHFLLITLWDSVAAIKRFAGEDYASARYYPADDEFLLEREARVQHFEVLADWGDITDAPISAGHSGVTARRQSVPSPPNSWPPQK